jgi:FkbM family methyltransferase
VLRRASQSAGVDTIRAGVRRLALCRRRFGHLAAMENRMQRLTLGGLDLRVVDRHEQDTRYIYDEIFVNQVYYHAEMRLPKHPVVMDVGANIGLYCVWAHRRYQPKDIYCYEASPRTFPFLEANVAHLVDPEITNVRTFNRALASADGKTLTLHQSPLVSGISTLLDRSKVRWVQQLSASKELITYEVVTSTVSAEMAANQIPALDVLKIDVEGYFMEVLKGIADADFERIRNLVVEIDYSAEAEVTPLDVERMLTARGYQTDRQEDTFYAWRS